MRSLPALLALTLLLGCQERASSVAEGEDGGVADAAGPMPDGGTDGRPAPEPGEPEPDPGEPEPGRDPEPDPEPEPDPDPQRCAYTPTPLGACTPLEHPPAACTVRVDGDRVGVATYGAGGRQTSWIDAAGDGYSQWSDADGTWRDTGEAGCVTRRDIEWPGVERAVEARVTGDGATCELTEPDAGAHAIDRLDDPGCDCRDVALAERCVYGDHGPIECVQYDPAGAVERVTASTYGDDGQLTERRHAGGDGEWDLIERWRHDAEGRVVEYLRTCVDCPPAASRRETWTYDEDGDRLIITRTTDTGDDGTVDMVVRRTTEGNRVVRLETGDADGFHMVVENSYPPDGFRSTTTVDGAVVRREARDVIDGVLVTTVVTAEGTRTERTRANDAGMLVERIVSYAPGGTFTERLTWVDGTRLVAEDVIYDGDPPFACALTYDWQGECPAVAGRFGGLCDFEPPW